MKTQQKTQLKTITDLDHTLQYGTQKEKDDLRLSISVLKQLNVDVWCAKRIITAAQNGSIPLLRGS